MLYVQATAALQSYCEQELSSIHSKVQVAQPLEMLDMSLQTPTYQALLARELVSSVRLRAMGDYKLGWLKGVARPPSQQVNAPPKTDMALTCACAALALQEHKPSDMQLHMHPVFEIASWLWQCIVAMQNSQHTLKYRAAN